MPLIRTYNPQTKRYEAPPPKQTKFVQPTQNLLQRVIALEKALADLTT